MTSKDGLDLFDTSSTLHGNTFIMRGGGGGGQEKTYQIIGGLTKIARQEI